MSNEFDPDRAFFQNLPSDFVLGEDAAQKRLFREYGAVFVARGGVVAPNKVVFKDEADVAAFQATLSVTQSQIGNHVMELQSAAMERLLMAVDEAGSAGLSITPRGKDSARRNYNDTVQLWKSRVEPALVHWVGNGRLSQSRADSIRALPPFEQLPEVFELEAEGIYFAKDLSKSIIYSVAPPGASQHLSMLAFDVAEYVDPGVREILARNYWYQTVVSDLPHFTFIGVSDDQLEGIGLKKVEGVYDFWVPDI